ncbi:hypothetical protein L9F63_002487, partial [Diploptera punctata]
SDVGGTAIANGRLRLEIRKEISRTHVLITVLMTTPCLQLFSIAVQTPFHCVLLYMVP